MFPFLLDVGFFIIFLFSEGDKYGMQTGQYSMRVLNMGPHCYLEYAQNVA